MAWPETLQLIKVKEYAIFLSIKIDILCATGNPAGNPTAHGKSKSLTVGSGESGSLDLKYPTAILLIDQEEL